MEINGVPLDKRQLYSESQIQSAQEVNLVERVNKLTQQIYNVETDEIYKELVGQDNEFDFDFSGSSVLKYQNNVIASDSPMSVGVAIDLAQNVVLDRAISSSTEDWILFINGYACYTGVGTATVLTPFTSTVPADDRNKGFIFMAASPDNVNVFTLTEDRVKLTFSLVGGGTADVWLSLPKTRDVDAADTLFFDKYGTCYRDLIWNKTTFVSSFTIFDIARFNKGAIDNELYFLRGYGSQIVKFLNIQNAGGYELTYLGQDWFGIPKRSGETDDEYRERLILSVVGEKCIPYSIKIAMLAFSPFVYILEGAMGSGAFNRSFCNYIGEGFDLGGAYTEYIAPALLGSFPLALFHIRIIIQSNVVTNDPIMAKFIYDLVGSLVMGAVTYDIQKI